MKKLFFALLLCSTALGANAQYQEGNLIGNIGFGVGVIGYGNFGPSYSGGFLPITINAEYSIDDRFAVGGYMGYFSRSYNNTVGADTYSNKFSVFSIGGRGTFHATDQLNEWFDGSMDARKLDIYASVLLGYEKYSWNYANNYPGLEASSGGLILGPVVGARYWFADNFGGYLELGRGTFSVATLGLSLYLF